MALERMANEMERAQEMATMGSWVLEVDTGEVSWTPALHRIFGQNPTCPVPTLEEQETLYTEKSWHAMIEAVTRTIQVGSPYNIELETVRRDGTVGVLRSIGEAERDEAGRIVRLRGVAQDISDIKQAEAKLKAAVEQGKIAQIYKDQFLANMSHEIRTPMNGIVGFASLLRDEGLDAETRDDYINTIESCSDHLLNLVNDIVDIAKIEAGEIQIQKKTLLGNALKFTDQGAIELGFESKNGAVVFFVKDEGIGIAPERIKLIFQRFEHLEGTTQKYESTGLGLSKN